MSRIRYGLIGAGMMGQEHIRNLRLLDGADVAALADPDAAMRRAARALAGDGCRFYADYRELLDAGGCDAFVIATPNHLHYPVLCDVLALDRPVLVEKPLCTELAHCRDVRRRARACAAPVWVAMEYRYMPPVQRLLQEVRAGTIGALRMLSIREHRFPFLRKVGDWNRFSRNTGGTLVEKCCHFFDLMRLLSGQEPVRVYASGAMDVNHRDERYDGETPDIIDNAYVIVDFDRGARAMLDLCMFAEGSYWQESIAATGDLARVEAFVPGPARFAADGRERIGEVAIATRAGRVEQRFPIDVDRRILAAGDHQGATYFQHRRFFELLQRGDGEPDVTLEDGLRAVTLGLAGERSARTGRPVTLTRHDF